MKILFYTFYYNFMNYVLFYLGFILILFLQIRGFLLFIDANKKVKDYEFEDWSVLIIGVGISLLILQAMLIPIF